MRFILGLFFILAFDHGFAQCITADFSSSPTACINQKLYFENLTTGASSYQWDFCSGELVLTPQATIAATNNLLFRTRSIRIIQQGLSWYGFTIDQASTPNRLIRFNFGNSLSNDPFIVDLGNPAGELNGAYDFQMYQESNNWYGLVVNTGSNVLLRLNFGNNLQSTPSVQNLGSFGVLNTPNGIFLTSFNGSLSAFVTNGVTSEIVRIDFGNSILNSPTASSFSISGGSGLRGITITRECDRWFGLVTSYSNGKVFWLDFINGLNQTPQSGEITFFTSYNFPANVSIALDGGEYYAFIQSALGEQYRLSFGSSILDKTGAGVNLGNYGISGENFALELIKVDSDWFGFSIDLANRRLVRLTFPTSCDANYAIIDQKDPPLINYTSDGVKKASLMVVSTSGAISSLSNSIVVSTSEAPDINFTSQNACVNNVVLFSSQSISGGITNYDWNFGDAGVSALPNPSHTFLTINEYSIELTVTAANGCQNLAQKQVEIYSEPIADFTLPAANVFCTNQDYIFVNASSLDVASNPTWEWSLNGNVVSSALDLSTQFSSNQPQEIKLKAAIPGCESEITKSISSVQTGPLTDFTFSNSCQGIPIMFTNTTTGTVVDYTWNFDDGNTSAQHDGVNVYSNSGKYQVTLEATNSSGCHNFATKEITIYSKPQPNFSLDLPPFSCSGSSSQFNDLTPPLSDSNISSRLWSFGDVTNGSSTQTNPAYTYNEAGDYQVSLQATSNFGCSNTILKAITISPSPVANFTNTPVCLNQVTQFTDASGTEVKAWLWSVQNSSYTTKNATHTFNTTGTQTAMLTVTGNNNCVSQISKAITIPVPVSIDFTSQNTCATKLSVFAETNSGGADPAVSWTWDFAGQSGIGSPAQHVFSTVGSFSVKLSSTRFSGCEYSVTKSINIIQPPVAQFTMTPESGGAPLTVGFTNTSLSTTNFLWKFNNANNSTSTEYSPSFVFDQLGTYPVELIASNSIGCSDSIKKDVQVVVPQINAALSGFSLTANSDGTLMAMVTVMNRSNIPISNPDIYLDLSGLTQVKEMFSGTIQPNQSITRTLTSAIMPVNLNYACAEVLITGDANSFDNRECINLNSEIVFIQPYPNPANEIIYLDWINQDLESFRVIIYNSSGQAVLNQTYSDLLPGLNQVEINVSQLAPGIYLASYSAGNVSKSLRFSVVH
ncbi:MAG: PKD domain-containing protein [Cyclobacteriaceae bacterium]